MKITSKHNPQFKFAMRLKTSRGRGRADRILIYGWRELERALASRPRNFVEEVFFCPELLDATQLRQLEKASTDKGVRLLELERELCERLSFGDRLDGVVGIAAAPDCDLTKLSISGDATVVVIEALEKPGNLGAVARVCDAGGVAALIAASPITDLFHPQAIRASMGAVFTVPLGVDTSEAVRRWLLEHKFRVIVATPNKSAAEYDECELTGRIALVLGSEAQGVSSIWLHPPSQTIRLPMKGVVDSLNISTAAAVLVYESLRQRKQRSRRP